MKETLHYDEMSDRLTVKHEQDVEPYLDEVKRRKEIASTKPVDGLGYYAGTIPEVIVLQYMREHGVTFCQFINEPIHIKRIMNDPDYKRFRVWEGRI